MKKIDIVNKLAEKSNLSQQELSSFVDNIFLTIKQALIQGKRIEIRGFGVFDTKKQSQILIHHPQTKKKMIIPEHKIPYFHVSHLLIKKLLEK